MKFSTVGLCTVGAVVMVFALSNDVSAETERSAWYVGGGIGVSWTGDMKQVGWNRDTYCYPDSCVNPGLSQDISGVSVPGYRWSYDLDVGVGSAFEIAVGRAFNRLRLEISAAQRKNDVDQQFAGITFLDGRPTSTYSLPADKKDSVVSNGMAKIDDITTRTLSFNAYYDFLDTVPMMTPYLGVGLGVAFVKISGVYFSSDYKDLANPSQDLSRYNSRKDSDESDTVLVGNLYAGADYSLTDETLLGLKFTYSMMDDVEDTGDYLYHPVHADNPAFTSHENFSGPRQWSVMMTVKYLFGD